ncbi:MAG TPA: MAC/perforin domain-containing protein [Thermoanaerobaculia bacterium]|nr:MAC/perforin domain-containing protein [Thermoanaerobaculia bacterium]
MTVTNATTTHPKAAKIRRNAGGGDETDAPVVQNLIPGAEMLGYSFNIFSNYSFDSAIRPLLQLGAPTTWNGADGKSFNVPENVGVPGGSYSSARCTTFETGSEFNSYFQSSASVEGSVGAFSASFSTSYSTEQRDSSSYSWALIEADVHSWTLNLQKRVLSDDVANDPDWLAVPDNFTPHDDQNVLAFFRFFQKYGTHYIAQVTAGGTLYYYLTVSRSAHYTSHDIQQSAMAEYHGLISSTKVEATRRWGDASSNWTQNRQARAFAVPATTAVLDWVNPPKDSWDEGGQFATWKKEVTERPSRTKFALRPIWDLFSGAKWMSLQLAYQAYANTRISVSASRWQDDTIMISGTPMFLSQPPDKTGAWQLVLIDSRSLKPVFNKTYSFHPGPRWPDDTYEKMTADLRPYAGNDAYILAAATSYGDMAETPTTDFYGVLRSFGAGKALDRWYKKQQHGCTLTPGTIAYALVGRGGSATGCEKYVIVTETDTPGVTVNTFLLPLAGSFYPQEYQS